ncbi:hypothetical protein L0Z13_08750 [Burkholderia multivorans]|uniref:HNH endonuclease n=1 Tax=Burkholderia multivorans TaxID=87883 RepID=UPI0005D8EE0B|nr:HNH endonuclease [Burkholderia multivorans]AJY19666.1 HNH endonuclease family protein [Burkholderia multivorans ATCC BAA-247]MBU9494157.1 hypothetical protein [Burkholderia multivorans]MCO1435929.1 hypothetical protein [Burkholderia multivorans]UQN61718.1 hypothetical protein L0Y94_18950 [Burkholderia multivorans]UQN64971.1 hypothetical protein L0Y92_22405 [Burkholderia multivorans]
MLRISDKDLAASANTVLNQMQSQVNREAAYPDQVTKALALWDAKRGSKPRREAFATIRDTLATMCIGPVRCAYCEDSAADEIEHVYPKSLFPERAFQWSNLLFACGPCNGPKSNKFGILALGKVVEFCRTKDKSDTPPPAGISALVDPRVEDPTELLELDLGGVTPDGHKISGTFMFVPRSGISESEEARAIFTIDTLGLNREVLRMARRNAFSGFRARLWEYVTKIKGNAPAEALDHLRAEIISTPHLSVFFEMRRQRSALPEVDQLLKDAPDAALWRLSP